MEVNEKDWKLYRSKLPLWQENYTAGLIKEYADFMNENKSPSEKFWWLNDRIKKDKRCPGVLITEDSRSYMLENILGLLSCGAIGLEDLSGFSDELKEQVEFIFRSIRG